MRASVQSARANAAAPTMYVKHREVSTAGTEVVIQLGGARMTERRVRSRGAPNIEFAEQPLSVPEVRAALLTCAGLYVVGGMLCATAALLPHVRAPEAIVAVAINALLVAAGLVYSADRARGGLPLASAADLWGVVLIAVLCAAGGGASSPFALIYLFAAGHAAAFQPPAPLLPLPPPPLSPLPP